MRLDKNGKVNASPGSDWEGELVHQSAALGTDDIHRGGQQGKKKKIKEN